VLSPRERAEAANVLAELGDPRPGVGLRNGLPDIDWVAVEPGPFVMGSDKQRDSDARDEEMPQFTCTLIKEPYRISRYPVTVAQYQAFVEAGGYQEQRFWTGEGWKWRTGKKISGPESYGEIFQASNHPQVGVSWYEATAFCRWLSEKLGHKVDLPTEAQWERASRHTDGRKFAWGNDFDASRCNMADTGIGGTSAVGIFPDDRAVCGAMDMCGNVWEWCRTVHLENYKDYQTKVSDDLEGAAARVLRGGAFGNSREDVRSADRYGDDPYYRDGDLGFRVVAPGL
jgi:formylglycine-generating enzyme required for sulfatase activity